MLMFVLLSSACAHGAARGSSAPVAASLPADCLDLQGQRELLAGVELEKGPQAAQLARCNVLRGAAVKYGDGQAQRADSAEKRLSWAVPVTGVSGVILGAVAAGLTAWAITRAQQAPQPAGAQ